MHMFSTCTEGLGRISVLVIYCFVKNYEYPGVNEAHVHPALEMLSGRRWLPHSLVLRPEDHCKVGDESDTPLTVIFQRCK